MASVNSQENRITKLKTSVGDTTLTLLDFSGYEYVNELNQFTVRALTKEPIELDDLLGKDVQIDIEPGEGLKRSIHQTVSAARMAGLEQDGYVYEFELRPWYWLLSHRVNCKIFPENTSLADIIRSICNEALGRGQDVVFQTSALDTQREYTVQYNESDLDFIRRHLEDHGVNFHCKMESGGHKWVLSDQNSAFAMTSPSNVDYNPTDKAAISTVQGFETMSDTRRVTSGAFRTSDYNFKQPRTQMEATHNTRRAYDNSGFEVYRFPGDYLENGTGRNHSRRRMEALRTQDSVMRATGFAPGLAAGTRFVLGKAAKADENNTYVVLQAFHQFSSNTYRSGGGGGGGGGRGYRGQYVVTKEANPVAPTATTARPQVIGPQTAEVVLGPEGNDDEHNRIRVRFFWDAEGRSMPCRVAQLWAGKGWGANFVPRVGMEVVVEFLHGNIDYPIVVGCVYNGVNASPYPFPGSHTQSGFKSESMGGSGFNELSFDDAGGSEKFNIHAQKDYLSTIENDSIKKIGNDAKTEISGTRTVTVTGDSTLKSTSGSVKIEASTQIELVCGSSKITMTPQQITISSTNVEVKATAQLKTTGLKAEHGATVDLAIQSAIVRINS